MTIEGDGVVDERKRVKRRRVDLGTTNGLVVYVGLYGVSLAATEVVSSRSSTEMP